jgi:hypothetical protein
MIRRLEPEEAPAFDIPEGPPPWIEWRNADLFWLQHMSKVASQSFVSQTAANVLVSGDEPALSAGVVEDPCALSKAIQRWIRVREEVGIGRIEADCRLGVHVKKVPGDG